MTAAVLVRPFSLLTPGFGGEEVTVYAGDTSELARLYFDTGATSPAPNPQVLAAVDDACGNYGHWQRPVYTSEETYRVEVPGRFESGVYEQAERDLESIDASAATVAIHGQPPARLDRLLATEVHVEQFGRLAPDAADNNTTLINKALARAAEQGGGDVGLPAGRYPVTKISLPARTRLRGRGAGVTILTSRVASEAVTIPSDDSGLADLTLDGEVAAVGGVGLHLDYARRVRLESVVVTRFALGLKARGGQEQVWTLLSLVDNVRGAEIFSNQSDRLSDGDASLRGILWIGGGVRGHSQDAVEVKPQASNRIVFRVQVLGVRFEQNLKAALRILGSALVKVEGGAFVSNLEHVRIDDATNVNPILSSRAIGFEGCTFDSGKVLIRGASRDIAFRSCRIGASHTWEIQPPARSVVLDGCWEIGPPATVVGDRSRLLRVERAHEGSTNILTDGSAPAACWSATMEPGQCIMMEALVAAHSLNGGMLAGYVVRCAARRHGSALAYDLLTSVFSAGEKVTGQTSGAQGTILVIDTTDSTTGIIYLRRISGTFLENEVVRGAQGGQASAAGPLTPGLVEVLNTATVIQFESDAGLNAAFTARGADIELTVTGIANEKMDWSARVIASATG